MAAYIIHTESQCSWQSKVIDGISIQMAKHEGCKLLTGGGKQPGQDKGFYVAPTIFTDVNTKHQLWNEEVLLFLLSRIYMVYSSNS